MYDYNRDSIIVIHTCLLLKNMLYPYAFDHVFIEPGSTFLKELPYFLGYKTDFFSFQKQSQRSRSVL